MYTECKLVGSVYLFGYRNKFYKKREDGHKVPDIHQSTSVICDNDYSRWEVIPQINIAKIDSSL